LTDKKKATYKRKRTRKNGRTEENKGRQMSCRELISKKKKSHGQNLKKIYKWLSK